MEYLTLLTPKEGYRKKHSMDRLLARTMPGHHKGSLCRWVGVERRKDAETRFWRYRYNAYREKVLFGMLKTVDDTDIIILPLTSLMHPKLP
jgi:hypothetical protein